METTKIKFEKDIPENSIIKTQKVLLDDMNYIIVGYFKQYYFCVADLQQKCVEKTSVDDTSVLEFIDQCGALWFKKGKAKDAPDFSDFVLRRISALSNQNLELASELQQQIKDCIIQLNTEESNDEEDETNVESVLKNYCVPLIQCVRNQYQNEMKLRNRVHEVTLERNQFQRELLALQNSVRDIQHNQNIPSDDIELRQRVIIYEYEYKKGNYRVMRAQGRYVRNTIRGSYKILWDYEYPNATELINKFKNKEFGRNDDYDIRGCNLILSRGVKIQKIIDYFTEQIRLHQSIVKPSSSTDIHT